VKYSFGAYCLAAVCGICVVPFAVLGVKLILLKAAAAIGEAVAGLKAGGLLNDCVVCCSMLLGLLGCCTLMVFISFISAMKAVT